MEILNVKQQNVFFMANSTNYRTLIQLNCTLGPFINDYRNLLQSTQNKLKHYTVDPEDIII